MTRKSALNPAVLSWRRTFLPLCLLLALVPTAALAGGGPFGIDYEWSKSDTGLWSRNAQVALEYAAPAAELVGALMLGNDSPIGHTFWQAADASIASGLAAQILKYSFSRARPFQGDNPNLWFQGHGDQSFPSGEVTLQASFVTPFIVDYYRTEPWVWSLEVLPVWDAIGRMKAQAHWQSDVIAGWLLGTAAGYWATTREVPLLVQILPRGLSIGFYKRF